MATSTGEPITDPRPLVGITIDCADPDEVAAFWERFLGYERRADQPQEIDGQYATVYKPSGVPGLHHVTFQKVPEPKRCKARAHLDLFVQNAAELVTEMRDAGATLATPNQHIGPVVVLLDPAGNEFCVIDTQPPND